MHRVPDCFDTDAPCNALCHGTTHVDLIYVTSAKAQLSLPEFLKTLLTKEGAFLAGVGCHVLTVKPAEAPAGPRPLALGTRCTVPMRISYTIEEVSHA